MDERGSTDLWVNGNLDIPKRDPTDVRWGPNGQPLAKFQDAHHARFWQNTGNVLDFVIVFQEHTRQSWSRVIGWKTFPFFQVYRCVSRGHWLSPVSPSLVSSSPSSTACASEDSACDDAVMSGEGANKAWISLSRLDATNNSWRMCCFCMSTRAAPRIFSNVV